VRILILNERDPRHPQAGGAETHVHEIFSRLAARGHRVAQLVSAFPGAARSETLDGVELCRLGRGWVPAYYALAARECAVRTRRDEFDVVVECLNKLPYLAPLYAKTPVLGLCHHLFGSAAFLQVSWPTAAALWCAERAIPWVFRRSRFVAISDSTRDDLVSRGVAGERIDVQLPGIRRPQVADFAPIAEREPWIIYVGRLEAYKRIDVLIDAMARLAPRHPELKLAVVGRGAARERLERRAREQGIAERVHFTGFVSDAERDAWLARARVCICPSAKEGFGLTVVEANVLGTPNVATDAPGLRDTVRDGETGYLVPEGDVQALASRAASLLDDDALAGRMSRAALSWSQRFDWDEAALAMERSLERAVRGG
jgi:glycosyltransferase involved in cell wall biosynthesis